MVECKNCRLLLAAPTMVAALKEIDVAIAAMQYEKARRLVADIRTLLEGILDAPPA